MVDCCRHLSGRVRMRDRPARNLNKRSGHSGPPILQCPPSPAEIRQALLGSHRGVRGHVRFDPPDSPARIASTVRRILNWISRKNKAGFVLGKGGERCTYCTRRRLRPTNQHLSGPADGSGTSSYGAQSRERAFTVPRACLVSADSYQMRQPRKPQLRFQTAAI